MDEFMKVKAVEIPRNIVAGHGVIDDVRQVCRDLYMSGSGTIITGGKTAEVAGKHVADLMDGYDIDICKVGNATQENVDLIVERARETRSTFILAVGGGSKIDLAKIVSKELQVPFISIPTSASHDGLASNRASIKSDTGSKSIESASPMGVIADTEIINKAPYRLLASGCADVISNLTAIRDWDFARRLKNVPFSRSAYSLSMHCANEMMEGSKIIKPGMEDSVWVAIKPMIMSGISMIIAGSSRPTSGAEHMFSHMLDIRCPGKALHGEQCGVGSIMTMYLHGGDWEGIRDALADIGAPTTAKELGIPAEEIVYCLSHANEIRSDRFTILGDSGITEDAAERVAMTTGVI